MTYRKFFVPLILSAAGCAWGQASEPNPLSVIPGGGDAPRQYHIHLVDKITFEGGNMVVAHAGGTDMLPVAEIEEICFDREYNATDDVTDVLAPGLDIAIRDHVITATAAPGTPVAVAVYDMSGMIRAAVTAVTEASVDLNPLPAGIYIVKVNDKTIKLKN